MEDTILRRTWAEIDLDALEHNYNVARQKIGPGVKYLGVVKADAFYVAFRLPNMLNSWGRTIWQCPVWTRAGNCATAALPCPF